MSVCGTWALSGVELHIRVLVFLWGKEGLYGVFLKAVSDHVFTSDPASKASCPSDSLADCSGSRSKLISWREVVEIRNDNSGNNTQERDHDDQLNDSEASIGVPWIH